MIQVLQSKRRKLWMTHQTHYILMVNFEKSSFEPFESQTWLLIKGQVKCQKPIKKHAEWLLCAIIHFTVNLVCLEVNKETCECKCATYVLEIYILFCCLVTFPFNIKECLTFCLLRPQYNNNHNDLNAKGAWALGYTGKGVVVSILDDGIEKNHPDLMQNYVSITAEWAQTNHFQVAAAEHIKRAFYFKLKRN